MADSLLEIKLERLRYLRSLQESLEEEQKEAAFAGLHLWESIARPKQLSPDHPMHSETDPNGYSCGCHDGPDHIYNIWLFIAGRGTGKTMAGSNWIAGRALNEPESTWAVIAPTWRDARVTCIEGSTGVIKALPEEAIYKYRRNELQVVLKNGSVIYGYSADQPERLRGSNLWGCWADELGSWRYRATWDEGLIPALRLGRHPRIVVTTTPRPTKLIRELMIRRDGSVHITRASTWENATNLSDTALRELRARYGGTRLGRQELEGELLTDTPGALWTVENIDDNRIQPEDVPELVRVVVAVDPSVSDSESAAETGIIVAGVSRESHGYILADYSMRGTPQQAMRRAVDAYREFKADRIVAEINNGGDFVGSLLATIDPGIPYKKVTASRGKLTRAEPVSSLYEQNRISHVGYFPELEDQMTSWLPTDPESPDRLDSCVWALTDLRDLVYGSWFTPYGIIRCGNPICLKPFIAAPGGKPRIMCPYCSTPISNAA